MRRVKCPRLLRIFFDFIKCRFLFRRPESLSVTRIDRGDWCYWGGTRQSFRLQSVSNIAFGCDGNTEKDLGMPSTEVSKIPSLAKPYIALQSHLHEGIPKIHDAWEKGNVQVILLEDRSNWQHLLDLWHDDSMCSLQIVHCFYQMTKLWVLLETVNCRQSLLEWSNLRLDEDRMVALQRLYLESDENIPLSQSPQETEAQIIVPEGQPSIKTLGRIWQALFRQSQRTQFGAMVQLLGRWK